MRRFLIGHIATEILSGISFGGLRLICVTSTFSDCSWMSKWIERHGTESLEVSSSLSMELVPGAQARDWRQRWVEIQEHLKRLLAPHSEALSAASIQNANHDLQSFFV